MANGNSTVRGSRAGGSYTVKVKIDRAAVNAVCGHDVGSGLQRAGERTKRRAAGNIRSAGRVRTGRMATDITVSPTQGVLTANGLFVEVTANAPYAMFQEAGTRAHGPVRAKRLVFQPKGSNTYVFAKRVRGVKAAHFMLRAAQAVTPEDFA